MTSNDFDDEKLLEFQQRLAFILRRILEEEMDSQNNLARGGKLCQEK